MEDRNLYIKIAHCYYTLGMTQDDIAKKLSLTRQRINKIINSLEEMGIVTIKINGFTQSNVAYENRLETHFGLNRVIVADTYENSQFLPMLANTAAQYLEDCIQPQSVIGVSWGTTLAETIANLSYRKKSGCTVVQMVGAQNIDVEMVKSDEIARSLADKLDSVCYMLYAPVIVDHAQTKQMLMQERTIKKSFEWMQRCDIALFGIGQLNEASTMYTRGFLKDIDIKILRENGFVGDLCVNPITIDGCWDNCFIRERVISANMEVIKAIPNVIAIAGGMDKAEAIISVLSSGVVDTLIVDDKTADRIVTLLDKKNQ